jgi:recombinational DNA repair protein RecT
MPTKQQFEDFAAATVMSALDGIPEEQRKAAAAAVATAFAGAVRNAQNPEDVLSCTEDSVATCAVTAALIGIYPTGTASTGAYLVPQKTRGRQTLQFRLNHRGYAEILRRSGYTIHGVAVGLTDSIDVDCDEVISHRRADLRSLPTGLDDLLGVFVSITDPHGRKSRPWVPYSVIVTAKSRSSNTNGRGPWNTDPISMAMGAAVRFLVMRGTLPVSGAMNAAIEAEARADATEAHAEPATTAPPPARAFKVPQPRAIAAPNSARQIAGPPIEEDWTPPPYGDPVPAQQAAPPTQAATPADAIKALRARRGALVNEICDLGGIGGDAANKTRAALRAAGCAEVANPDEAALTTQIDLLTAHLAEAKVAAFERDAAAESR